MALRDKGSQGLVLNKKYKPKKDKIRDAMDKAGIKGSSSFVETLAKLAGGGSIQKQSTPVDHLQNPVNKKKMEKMDEVLRNILEHLNNQYNLNDPMKSGIRSPLAWVINFLVNELQNLPKSLFETKDGFTVIIPIVVPGGMSPEDIQSALYLASLLDLMPGQEEPTPIKKEQKPDECLKHFYSVQKGKLTDEMRRAIESQYKAIKSKMPAMGSNQGIKQQWVQDPKGTIRKARPNKGIAEIGKLVGTSWAMKRASPVMFIKKLHEGGLEVNDIYRKIDQRPYLYILIDGSGSMDGDKVAAAISIALHYLEQAYSDKLTLWISGFDSGLHQDIMKVETLEQAKQAMAVLVDSVFTGGGTNIYRAVQEAIIRVREEKIERATKPEILVITDDDDTSRNLKVSNIDHYKIHGVSLNSKNEGLANIVKETGGIFQALDTEELEKGDDLWTYI